MKPHAAYSKPRRASVEESEAMRESAEMTTAQSKIASKKEDHNADLITQVIDGASYVTDATFPWFGINLNGQWTRFRASRWYYGHQIVVDMFFTQKEYDAALVEKRRSLCHQNGFRYAALGPSHNVGDGALAAQLRA